MAIERVVESENDYQTRINRFQNREYAGNSDALASALRKDWQEGRAGQAGSSPFALDSIEAVMDKRGVKYDDHKPPMSLLSRVALEAAARVLAFGAKKYDAWNWSNGIAYSRVVSALIRHALAYADGEQFDPETGESHMAHVMCCAMFLLDYEKHHPEMNDLRKHPQKANVQYNLMTPLERGKFEDFARG